MRTGCEVMIAQDRRNLCRPIRVRTAWEVSPSTRISNCNRVDSGSSGTPYSSTGQLFIDYENGRTEMAPGPTLGQPSTLPCPVGHPGDVTGLRERPFVPQSPTVMIGQAGGKVFERLPQFLPHESPLRSRPDIGQSPFHPFRDLNADLERVPFLGQGQQPTFDLHTLTIGSRYLTPESRHSIQPLGVSSPFSHSTFGSFGWVSGQGSEHIPIR